VNELITNAVKYGYKGETGGKLAVSVASAGEQHFNIGVRDEGAGLPDGFDPGSAKSLGMRIINSFCKQLNGHLSVRRWSPGTEFIIAVPAPLLASLKGTSNNDDFVVGSPAAVA